MKNIERLIKYIKKVKSPEYEKSAWDNFHNGNKKFWNKWASRLQVVANAKIYYKL